MPSANLGRAILARLVTAGLWAGMALLALMASLVVLQVLARNFADLGLPWADELARFSGIGLVFLTVPLLAARGAMVAVSTLPDALPVPARRWTTLAADLATLAFCALLLWGFAEFLPRAGKFLTPAMRVSNFVYYSLALVGSAMLGLIALVRVLDGIAGRDPSAHFPRPDEETGAPQ